MIDSVKKIPELAIFLIENALDLFDHFEEEGPLLPPASNTNNQLHQSTDSGLSDGAIDEVPTTTSPDSILFDSSSPPLSDSAADNNEFKTTPSIEELPPETIIPSEDNNKQLVVRPYQSAFSPRNDDNSNNFSWSPSALASRRLNRHGAFRSTLSSSSQSSSPQERSPEPTRVQRIISSSIFSPERRRKSFGSNTTEIKPPTIDPTINHRKKESTDSTKTLVGRSDSMSSRRITSPPTVHESRSAFPIRPSLITSPRSTARRALLSKNETLGLPEPARLISRPPNDLPSHYRPVIQERQTPFRPPRRTPNNELILGTKV